MQENCWTFLKILAASKGEKGLLSDAAMAAYPNRLNTTSDAAKSYLKNASRPIVAKKHCIHQTKQDEIQIC